MQYTEELKTTESLKKDILAQAGKAFAAGRPPEKSQLQNLRSAAAATTCPEELVLFVRYQMGRGESKFPEGFGNAVISGIEAVSGNAKSNKLEPIKAVRLYCGYLVRLQVAGRKHAPNAKN